MSVPTHPGEEWRPIPDWDGYEVSNLGRVVSHRRGRPIVLKGYTNPKGYRFVNLFDGQRSNPRAVHRLVMLTFVGPRPDGLEIRHLDGDQLNNAVDNLAYGTRAENLADQIDHGTHPRVAPRCRLNHQLTKANAIRDEDGRVWCRKCTNMRAAYEERRANAS